MTSKTFQIFIVMFLLPAIALGDSFTPCKVYPFLKNGFDLKNYDQCHKLIYRGCKSRSPLPEESCVKKLTGHVQVCFQLKKLSTALQSSPAMIKIKKTKDGFAVIEQVFPADGQHDYYVISPKGCLLATRLDPRTLNKTLNDQYKNVDFLMVSIDEPQQQSFFDGTQSFMVNLKILKTCMACEVIGFAKIRYDFSRNGESVKSSLVSFHNS